MDTKLLFELSSLDAVGNIADAADRAVKYLSQYCEIKNLGGLSNVGYLKGESDYTVLLDAHIDQISMVVTDIDENGFLTVNNAGGIDVRMLPAKRVTVHGKEKITGVFCSVPPHLAGGDPDFSDISNFKIDSLLGKRAKDLISLGDFVTFCEKPELLGKTKVTGRSFDDRAGVVCLIETAKKLKDRKLPVSVAFLLSDGEELGMRGAKTSAFELFADEAVAVDVTFGDGIGIGSFECGKLGQGGMIGISPVLDRKMSQKLINIAKDKNIPFGTEVMGERTGTDADVISVSKSGIKSCTLSIPLRNMHTDCEILDLRDLDAVCDLLCEYILSGGVKND